MYSVTWVIVPAFYSAMQYIEAAVFNLQCKQSQHTAISVIKQHLLNENLICS